MKCGACRQTRKTAFIVLHMCYVRTEASIGVTLREGYLELPGVRCPPSLSVPVPLRTVAPVLLRDTERIILPHVDMEASASAFSFLRFSKLSLYRSYDSRKCLSTREVNMSSPRGFVHGGIGVIVVVRRPGPSEAVSTRPRAGCNEEETTGRGGGRIRFNAGGTCIGGARTLRNMLNDRRALLA